MDRLHPDSLREYRGVTRTTVDGAVIGWDVFVLSGSKPPYPLDPQLSRVNHSPTGFSWGYHGSGPAQLAFALLCDAVDGDWALTHYGLFKAETVSKLDMRRGWSMTCEEIQGWAKTRRWGLVPMH